MHELGVDPPAAVIGQILRLELGPYDMDLIQRPDVREACVRRAKACGFTYVTLDLEGYRTGSMNEPLR